MFVFVLQNETTSVTFCLLPVAFSNCGLLLKERICSLGSKLCRLRISFLKRETKAFRVASRECIPIQLKVWS